MSRVIWNFLSIDPTILPVFYRGEKTPTVKVKQFLTSIEIVPN